VGVVDDEVFAALEPNSNRTRKRKKLPVRRHRSFGEHREVGSPT